MKRFWETTQVVEQDNGYAVLLDDKGLRTPSKKPFVVAYRAIAEWVAQECDAQTEEVNAEAMPVMRLAGAVLDKVIDNRQNIVENLANYGGSDLLCYRADSPQELVEKQADAWDPILDWTAKTLDAPLNVTQGVIPVDQPATSLQNLKTQLEQLNPYQLAAAHELVSISGSLVLPLSLFSNHISVEEAWNCSRVDENWQISLWGADEEAEATADKKRRDFLLADKFWRETV